MSIQLATIATNIAAISVSGLTIKNISGIPEAWDGRVPIMFPNPINYVANLNLERLGMGGNASAFKTINYDLRYTFCFVPVGSGRIDFDGYANMVSMACLIMDTFGANDIAGAVNIDTEAVDWGPVSDPVGNLAHGCTIVFHVEEYINA